MVNAITDAVICCFFGTLGIHKFVKKRIVMGLVYLFTFGLFGFGWLHDTLRAVLVVLDVYQKKTIYEGSITDGDPVLSVRSQKIMDTFMFVFKIIALVIIGILCIVALPSWGCFLGFFAIILLLPLPQWQAFIHKFLNNNVKHAIAAILVLVMVVATVPANTQSGSSVPVNGTAISITTTTATKTTMTTSQTAVTTTTTTSTTTTTTTTTTTEPPHVHEFADATCNEPQTCDCGETESYALGHSYSDGSCYRCGVEDPDYVEEEMVWLPKSGEKYHSKPICGRMNSNRQVPISQAKARGYEPCSNCY